MIAISLRFPSGRYHATPWGRHVNEGVPEWPPSPWRLMRAMVATWKRKLDGQWTNAQMKELLRLLSAPPHFVLPPASVGHTRHYIPWYKKGPEDRTLVFDTFVAVSKDSEVVVFWPDENLKDEHAEILNALLINLGYLGRAEGWCEGRILSSEEASQRITGEGISVPLNGSGSVSAGVEIVRTLCLDSDTAFLDDGVVEMGEKSIGRGKNKVVEQVKSPVYDPSWNFCVETLRIHKKQLSDPPGSRWVRYTRPSDCFTIKQVSKRLAPRKSMFQVARFSLDSRVLPLVTETLPLAEAARRTLMGIHGRLTEKDGERGKSRIFSGKEANGTPLRTHGHAYYLPTDEDGDGRLDHLTIVAHEGFPKDELRSLDRLRKLAPLGREGDAYPIQVLLLGLGTLKEFSPAPLKKSASWISVTPFVAQRFPKDGGTKKDSPELLSSPKAFLEALIRENLEHWKVAFGHDIDLSRVQIKPLVDENDVFRLLGERFGKAQGWRPIQFQRFRRKRGDDGGRRLSGFFQIDFGTEVPGPLALGHSSHFGLGLFAPAPP